MKRKGPKAKALTDPTGVLAEAIQCGNDAMTHPETAVKVLGNWILDHIFAGDSKTALAARRTNGTWRQLRALAGGPKFLPSRRMLYVSLSLAVKDALLKDPSWHALDTTRKELLLPLREDSLLCKAAKHVREEKLTLDQTRAYVRLCGQDVGRRRSLRVTPHRAAATVARLHQTLDEARYRAKLKLQLRELSESEKQAVKSQLDALIKHLKVLRREVQS